MARTTCSVALRVVSTSSILSRGVRLTGATIIRTRRTSATSFVSDWGDHHRPRRWAPHSEPLPLYWARHLLQMHYFRRQTEATLALVRPVGMEATGKNLRQSLSQSQSQSQSQSHPLTITWSRVSPHHCSEGQLLQRDHRSQARQYHRQRKS